MSLKFRSAPSLLALSLTGTLALSAQTSVPCGPSNDPSATLLLPYFEVDRTDPNGRSTLFSVGNVDAEAKLAHAVVWTNWGHPVLSFDFFVAPGAVQTFNVRNVLNGILPSTSPPNPVAEAYANCTAPLTQPTVEPAAMIDLLAGQPSAADGLCYSKPIEDGNLLTGSITIDVVQDCSGASLMSSNEESYMGDCATGLAGNDNVLWGDFILVDPSNDSAQGDRLVGFVADQARFGVPFLCVDPPCGWRVEETFQSPEGNRMPLARSYETRFLSGGAFDGGTDLIVWLDGQFGPTACDAVVDRDVGVFLQARFRNEKGEQLTSELVYPGRSTGRIRVGSDELPAPSAFGLLELSAFFSPTGSGLADAEPRQLHVLPQFSALGRYSVGLATLPVADFCSEEVP